MIYEGESLIERIRRGIWSSVEPILFLMLVYAPWAINSEPAWCFRGLMLIATVFSVAASVGKPQDGVPRWRETRWHLLISILAGLFLTYVLISAVNARAQAVIGKAGVSFIYREALLWLPHTYDAGATWNAWFKHLTVAGVFFGTCRWVRVETARRSEHRGGSGWPAGIRRLIWVLSISSGIMAIEAIVQRILKTDYLLFFVTRYTWDGYLYGKTSLGPFAYQGSGVAYFNMIWPLTLGFWWSNQVRVWKRTGARPRFGASQESILPILSILMISCVLVSTSRTGVAVAFVQGVAIVGLTVFGRNQVPRYLRYALLGGGLLVALAVAYVGWTPLLEKLGRLNHDNMGGRLSVYRQVLRMIPDFDPWGGGAQSFLALNNLYTDPSQASWESMVHNDWLEARFSYGWVGFGLLILLVIAGVGAWRTSQNRAVPSEFSPFLAVTLGGLFLDGCFDIPLQTHSLHLIFGTFCAIALYAKPGIRDHSRSEM